MPKGDIVWYQAGTRLRPYGYPRSFVPNIAHQHILVLRKPPPREAGLKARDSALAARAGSGLAEELAAATR